ncbi:hypothetical protein [Desulfovibrio sp. JC010]|uniref:hypothetical protein n=1 Tax=Desulfovibrio sp. JC010 TaxID=2593641 RepID=UPI0013D1087F|nr:hypothetical protein [Desulfovibrio sp. JC010]NDV27522.1 hypothetical protein [Desulfovibrio sp. JC010]
MDIFNAVNLTVGLTGSVASIASLLIPRNNKNTKLIHAIYIFMFIVSVGVGVNYYNKYSRTINAKKSAQQMVENRNMHYTHRGYILATLSFLEKNKDLFPDTYERAKLMCEKNHIIDNVADSDSVHIVEISFAFEGLLKGIIDISPQD